MGTNERDDSQLLQVLAFAGGGASALFVVCLLVMLSEPAESWSAWLYRWQTLISGIAALASGLLAVRAILNQISETRRQSDEVRVRANFARRARLPLALSNIDTYCDDCLRLLRDIAANHDAGGQLVREMPEAWQNRPALPTKDLDAVCLCIESATPTMMEALAKLIENIQVQNSRLEDSCDAIGRKVKPISCHEIDRRVLEVLEVKYQSIGFFDFARRRLDKNPVMRPITAWDAERNGFPEHSRPTLHELIRLYQRSASTSLDLA